MKRTGFKPKPRKPMKRTAFKRVVKKTVKKKRSKLPTVKSVRNQCDKLLTPIIKAQHPHCFLQQSETCAYVTQVAHHHVHKSKSTALRYELDNLIPLCHSCHLMLHQNESKWASYIVEQKGVEWSQNLRQKDVQVKADVHFYIANKARLQAILEECG